MPNCKSAKHFNGEDMGFSTNCAGAIGHMQVKKKREKERRKENELT